MSGFALPPLNIPALLRQYGLHPHKGLGQNFLQDDGILQMIVNTADLGTKDVVLEIGPGLGSLTRHLALAAHSVIAVELDRDLLPVLKSTLSPYTNVHVMQGDILDLDPAELVENSGYIVVANIPYYITSAVIRHLLESQPRPCRLVLTVQKEVASRICAVPGDMNLLALSVQVYGNPSIVGHISAEAFYPAPKVDSSVVRMDIFPEPVIPNVQLESFFRLAKAGFSQKRKTLRNSLSPLLGRNGAESLLASTGIDSMRRAETVSLEEWRIICEKYALVSGS
jgi:16S rRNA (adenine1518-N6/adenine1519-N6)-dimethyltransferase